MQVTVRAAPDYLILQRRFGLWIVWFVQQYHSICCLLTEFSTMTLYFPVNRSAPVMLNQVSLTMKVFQASSSEFSALRQQVVHLNDCSAMLETFLPRNGFYWVRISSTTCCFLNGIFKLWIQKINWFHFAACRTCRMEIKFLQYGAAGKVVWILPHAVRAV